MLNISPKNGFSFLFNAAKANQYRIATTNRHRTKSRRPVRNMNRIWVSCTTTANQQLGLPLQQKRFKLLSYNILAQDLLVEHLYIYADIEPQLLRWEHRLFRLIKEITHIAPDIVCLQEMQFNHLHTLVNLIKGPRQLEFVYKKKTGHRTDGCAIIYDKCKFQLIEYRCVEYYTPNVTNLNRENIAIMARFRLRDEPCKEFIVATTHLLYNPKRQNIRIAQVERLLSELNTFAVNDEKIPLPVLLTGDFNFERYSKPYNLLIGAWKRHPSTNECDKTASSSTQQAENESLLQLSAMNFGEGTASTFQDAWTTVDFVLRSVDKNRQQVQVSSVYQLPNLNDCYATGHMPNRYLGSDHFSLAIVFHLC